MRSDRIMESQTAGKNPQALCARMEEELAFFEGAVGRARRWRASWQSAADEARVPLLAEQGDLIRELMGRGEDLEEIRDEWHRESVRWEGDCRERFRALAGRLDAAMRSLLAVEKENFEATRAARDELLGRILEVREHNDAHRVYTGTGQDGPSCVDREL
jgi:hypothetical protein